MIELVLVLAGAFFAAFAVGLAGFGDALIAAAFWLHVLSPQEAVPLILSCGVILYGVSVFEMRRHIRLPLLWPFLVGGLIGTPLGTWLLGFAEPAAFRNGIGAFLIVYSAFALVSARLGPVKGGGSAADGAVGLTGGVLGGFAGLSGVLPTIWCGLRGWPKDTQRGVYQPYVLAMHGAALASFTVVIGLDWELGVRFAQCVPAILIGVWLGHRLYRRINETHFRRVILGLILVSGISLVAGG